MPVSSPSPRSIRALRARLVLCCVVLATAGLAACGQSLPTAPDAQQAIRLSTAGGTSSELRRPLRDGLAPSDSVPEDSTNTSSGDKGFWW